MSEAQAANDLMKLDPNVALRMGLASSKGSLALPTNREVHSSDEEVDDDDLGAAIEEEETQARNDPLKRLLDVPQKTADHV